MNRVELGKLVPRILLIFLMCFVFDQNDQVYARISREEAREQVDAKIREGKIRKNERINKGILQEVKTEYSKFQLGNSKRVVLILGNKSVGKTVLSLLLAADIKSLSFQDGIFGTKDETGQVTNVSVTLVPQLRIDADSETSTYYDFPGFSHSRPIAMDILAKRSIHKLLHFVDEVKLVFVTDFDSVRDVEKPDQFIKLTENAMQMIKDISKYKDGMALIVTKVDKNGKNVEKDQVVIDNTLTFLKETKNRLENSTRNGVVEFIDALLKSNRKNEQAPVEVCRTPVQDGDVHVKNRMIKIEKTVMLSMINDDLQFIPIDKNDFDYTINNRSRIAGLMSELEHQIKDDVSKTIAHIQNEYIGRKAKNSTILNALKEVFSNPSEIVSKLNLLMKIVSHERISTISENIELQDFLRKFADASGSANISAEIKAKIDKLNDKTQNNLLDSVIRIVTDIDGFYDQQERNHYLELGDIKKRISLVLDELSDHTAEQFVLKLNGMSKIWRIYGLNRDLKQVSRYTEYLQVMSSKQLLTQEQAEKIDRTLKKCVQNLTNMRIWYNFLLELRTQLSTYSVQTSTLRNEQIEFISQIDGSNKQTKDIGINRLFDLPQISNKEAVEQIQLNYYKLKALQMLWNETMRSEATISCLQNNRLVASGAIILLSEVIKSKCWRDAKFVDIFALRKVFIDTDLDKRGQRVNLTIISPVWEIVSNRTILFSLHGKNENNTVNPVKNGSSSKDKRIRDGSNGVNGMAGGSGGNFLAIGNTFIKGNQLKVDVSGGKGGTGQSGGSGGSAVSGINVESPNFEENIQKGFMCEVIENKTSLCLGFENTFHMRKCYEVSSMAAGNGGRGGCFGIGGNPGHHFLIGLKSTPEFTVTNKAGENGTYGNGGKGGSGGKKGDVAFVCHKTYTFACKDVLSDNPTNFFCAKTQPGAIIPVGIDGKSGADCPLRPEPVYFHASPIVRYKLYARQSLGYHMWKPKLLHFLQTLNVKETINSMYEPINFIEEFKDLENDYFNLRKKLNFIPIYQSLQRRIDKYSAPIDDSTEEKKGMILVNTAVTSKIFAIRNNEWHITVLDLLGHLNAMKDDINDLRSTRKSKHIAKYRENYNKYLNEKINTARELIDSEIEPVIEKTFREIDENIEHLLDEILKKNQETIQAYNKSIEYRNVLEDSMHWHRAFGTLKLVGSALSLLGPPGLVAGAFVQSGAAFGESVTDTIYRPKKVTVPVGPQKKLIIKVVKDHTRNVIPFLRNVNKLAESVQSFSKVDLEMIDADIYGNAVQITNDMNKITNESSISALNQTAMFTKLKDWSESVVKNEKLYYEAKKKRYGKIEDEDKMKEKTQIAESHAMFYERFLKVFECADVAVQFYSKMLNDSMKLNEANVELRNIEDQLMAWKKYEESIYEIIIPQLVKIEETLKQSNFDGESHAQLDIRKWQAKGTLEQLKKLFREVTSAQQSLFESDFIFAIEKIQDGIKTMISVYDRIDSYLDQEKLAELIANVADPQTIKLNNPATEKAMFELNEIIISNLILERYESAVQAVKLQYFPIAPYFLGDYELIPGKLIDNHRNIEDKISEMIEVLRDKLTKSANGLMGYDDYMLNDHLFDHTEPIYTWNYDEFKKEIAKLLNGEPVTLKADITKGLHYSALKFKKASLFFKLEDKKQQAAFNAELEKYEISMEAVDRYYFRCDNRVYHVPHDNNVKFGFRINHAADDAYNKISNNHYFLSPYTAWKIQLTLPQNVSSILTTFENERLDLLLTGTGQYLKTEKYDDTCTEELNKYYKFSFLL